MVWGNDIIMHASKQWKQVGRFGWILWHANVLLYVPIPEVVTLSRLMSSPRNSPIAHTAIVQKPTTITTSYFPPLRVGPPKWALPWIPPHWLPPSCPRVVSSWLAAALAFVSPADWSREAKLPAPVSSPLVAWLRT